MESPWECPVLVRLSSKESLRTNPPASLHQPYLLSLAIFFFFQFFGSWKEQGSSVVISETLLLLGPDLE